MLKDSNKFAGMGQSQEREGPLDISPEKPRVIQLSLPANLTVFCLFYNGLYRCHFPVLDYRARNFSREHIQ